MPRRRPIASARISTARTCSKAGSPSPGARRHRLAQPRAGRAAAGRPGRSREQPRAFAVGPVTPLVVRGQAPVLSWTPPRLLPASDDTQARLLDLYRHTDPKLAARARGAHGAGGDRRRRRHADAEADAPAAAAARRRCAPISPRPPAPRRAFLAEPDGPRVGALAFDGWDTHVNEGAAIGRLANLLGALDGALAAIETGMGEAWRETVVAVVTEFGRTARINGTDGTDHGTAHGGAARRRRPQGRPRDRRLAGTEGREQLYEGRDLKPTTDLRAVLKGVLRDHLRVDDKALADAVFPDSAAAEPMTGLVG